MEPTGEGNRKKMMLLKGRWEDEQWEQDEEKQLLVWLMNPLTLDCHIHVDTAKMTTFHPLLSVPSTRLNLICFCLCKHLITRPRKVKRPGHLMCCSLCSEPVSEIKSYCRALTQPMCIWIKHLFWHSCMWCDRDTCPLPASLPHCSPSALWPLTSPAEELPVWKTESVARDLTCHSGAEASRGNRTRKVEQGGCKYSLLYVVAQTCFTAVASVQWGGIKSLSDPQTTTTCNDFKIVLVIHWQILEMSCAAKVGAKLSQTPLQCHRELLGGNEGPVTPLCLQCSIDFLRS